MNNRINGEINIYKFLFSIIIVIFHISIKFDLPYFTGGYIFVEWFFIFSGYTIANRIFNINTKNDSNINFINIIYNKISKIYPYYVVSCIIALIFKIIFKQIIFDNTYIYHRIVYEFFLLQMLTLNVFPLTGTAWFLSSMLIALFIIVPIFIRFKNKFFAIICILISILIYVYIYKNSGYLYSPAEWLPLSYKGNLRALAGILLGIFGYVFSVKLRESNFKSNLLTIITNIFYIILIFNIYRKDDGIEYFLYPFIFTILIY